MPEDMCEKHEDILVISLVTSAALLMILIVVTLVLLSYFGILRFKSNTFDAKISGSHAPKDQSRMPKKLISLDDDSHIYNDTESDSESDVVFIETSSCVMLYPTKPQLLVEPSQKPERYRRMSSENRNLNRVSLSDEQTQFHVHTNEEPVIHPILSNTKQKLYHVQFNDKSELNHLESSSTDAVEHVQSTVAVTDQNEISHVGKENPKFSGNNVNSHYSKLKHLQIKRASKSTYNTVEVNNGHQVNFTTYLFAKKLYAGRRNSS